MHLAAGLPSAPAAAGGSWRSPYTQAGRAGVRDGAAGAMHLFISRSETGAPAAAGRPLAESVQQGKGALAFETGRLAPQADSAVTATHGQTCVLAAIVAEPMRADRAARTARHLTTLKVAYFFATALPQCDEIVTRFSSSLSSGISFALVP